MKKLLAYILVALFFTACEDVYYPDLENRENALVVDARLVYGSSSNFIKLTETDNFSNQDPVYPAVTDAVLTLIDSNNSEVILSHTNGGYYPLNFALDPAMSYKLKIEYKDEIYESEFENVPPPAKLDTVYGSSASKITNLGGVNSVDDLNKKSGVQLYADIQKNENVKYYQFTATKIMQYTYVIMVPFMGSEIAQTVFGWTSFQPQDYFNIAAPAEYGTSENISKHPLFFLEKEGYLGFDEQFAGWILILYQHSISESAYNFYHDLNNQLTAEGKLFDPAYVQARNNLKCVTNPQKLIFGNFEISAVHETRYFVRFVSKETGYKIKPIPYFYSIPKNGEQVITPPEFWEYDSKPYP